MRILLFILCFMPFAAQAACYSLAEAEADQAIRIHSELMVIGLNCQVMGAEHGYNLYGDYKSFTVKHADLFESYEDRLLKFYKAQGQGIAGSEATLNTLRTQYANKISNDAAQMRPDLFCSTYAPRIGKALVMKEDTLRKWAGTIYESHPVSYPICAGG